jgi:hypothetical protein
MEGKPAGAVMAASGHHGLSMHDRYVNPTEQDLKTAFLLTERLHEKDVDESKSVSY